MKNIKNILVGIDIFEKQFKNVLKRSLLLAKQNNAKLFIVHAVKTPWFDIPNYFESTTQIVIDKAGIKKKIDKSIKSLSKDFFIPYFIFIKEGNPHDILLYESKLNHADMIIIGSHSKFKDKIGFLGSTTQTIVNKCHIPVLVVKNLSKKPYKNIIAPTDFEMQSKNSILFSKNISTSSKINIVHAYERIYMTGPYLFVGRDLSQYNDASKHSSQTDLKDFIKDLKSSDEISIKKSKVIDGKLYYKETLLDYINNGKYDLVVMGSKGNKGLNPLIGSVANYILRETSLDVLIYVK